MFENSVSLFQSLCNNRIWWWTDIRLEMQRHIIELKRVDGINEITKKVITSNHKTFELELELVKF